MAVDDSTTTGALVDRIRAAITTRDPRILEPQLADDARWESCVGREQVIEYMERAAGLDLEVEDVNAHRDRIVLTLRIADRPGLLHQVVFVRDGTSIRRSRPIVSAMANIGLTSPNAP